MTIPTLNLDNTTFEEIFKQTRQRISQFSELWSDHNFSDPGITFLELFAWLAEMKIYSINNIPKNNYLKLLQNLGFTPKLPEPTSIIVSFAQLSSSQFLIPKNSLLYYVEDSQATFEIKHDVEVIPFSIKKMLKFFPLTGYSLVKNLEFDDSQTNHEPSSWNLRPFGEKFESTSFCLGFDNLENFTGCTISLFLKIKDLELEKFPYGEHDDEPSSILSFSKLKWEWARAIDDQTKEPIWENLLVNSSTNGLSKSGTISFTNPFKQENKLSIETPNSPDKKSELLWIRCTLEDNQYQYSPMFENVYLNPVLATSGQIYYSEGNTSVEQWESNGMTNQKLVLEHNHIIRILELISTSNTSSKTQWQHVRTLDYSTENDLHFKLDEKSGTVFFGNGKQGKIPPKGTRFQIKYRYGKAKIELPNNASFNLQLKSQDSLKINAAKLRYTAHLGTESESIEDTFYRARRELSIPHVAVTAKDFEQIAISTPGLRVARAAATMDAEKQETIVTVIPYSSEKKPEPNQAFLDSICKHLDKHRLLTTYLTVSPPNYIEISVNATIKTNTNISEHEIVRKLNDFLSPISRKANNDGWQIGRSVYRSEISAIIEEIPGVDCIQNISIIADDKNNSYDYEGDNVIIKEKFRSRTFVCPGTHSIDIVHSQESCKVSTTERGYSH